MNWLRVAISAGMALAAGAALGGGYSWEMRKGSPSDWTASNKGTALSVSSAGAAEKPAPIWTNRAPSGVAPHAAALPAEAGGRDHAFQCTPFAILEGESTCGPDYVDTYNGGCNTWPPVFQEIEASGFILGESGYYYSDGGLYRDTDWYQVVLTEPTRLIYAVTAEFPLEITLVDGDLGCIPEAVLATAVCDPCHTATIDQGIPAGTYWLCVAPQLGPEWDPAAYPCGKQYCAELSTYASPLPAAIACPPDSFPDVWQLAYGEDGPWTLYVSNDRFPGFDPANGVLRYDHFAGIGSSINGIHWWGISAAYDDEGNLVECPLDPGQFHVGFWLTDHATGRPDYGSGEFYGFDVTGAALTKTDTGHVYRVYNDDGSTRAEYSLWFWSCELPEPLELFSGWITVQNTDGCAFWWAGSPGPVTGTGGVHVVEDQSVSPATRQDVLGDVSYCLTSDDTGPFYGACCPTDTGLCRFTSADECIGSSEEFSVGRTCDEIDCDAEEWACCLDDGHSAFCQMYSVSSCVGVWWRDYVCSAADPGYDPTAFGGAGNIHECVLPVYCSERCDGSAAYSRSLAGGYLYISWDHGAGDQRYVIDSFTGFSDAITRVKWWGHSTQIWDGPDCSFENPAPFVIRFYHSSAGGPDYARPAAEYGPIYAEIQDTGWGWLSPSEMGNVECYVANLPSTYSPGSGTQWVSIASMTTDCDFIWCPGQGSTPGQWFYDNGTCEQTGTDRHRSFCLHTDVYTGACCDELTGVCSNGVPQPDCLAVGQVFYRDLTCAAIDPCTAHVGACCDHTDGTCTTTLIADCMGAGRIWLGIDSSCDQCCVALCPPEGIPEGEPPCGAGYVDTYNIGCFGEAPSGDAFTSIHDGQVICGKTGIYTDAAGRTARDLDFYRYELTDTCAVVHATVRGEFRPDVWLMPGQCFTESWCGVEQTYVLTYSQATAAPCESAVASAPLWGPGFYYVMVSCYGELGDVPCETPYTLEVQTEPAGECTIGEDHALRSQTVCLVLGGTWEPCVRPLLATADANCDGLVNTFDIDPFVMALTDQTRWEATYGCQYLSANDCNRDGAVNVFDIDPFVICLTSGGCPER